MPQVTALLPARNAAADLPGWLQAAARVADRVIALDDGSTDATAELLEGSPLVELVLRNPVRPGYAGWDDAANRQRLLDAAIERGGGWVLYLDADERIDADDAGALREFVAGDAIPGCAYGLQVYRAWGARVAAPPTYVYRLFAAAPGQRLPEQTLHLNPVPETIPRVAWLRTTIRARHLESAERLEARRRKYAEADPGDRWDSTGRTPLHEPRDLVAWAPRRPDLAVLAVGAEGERAAMPPVGGDAASVTALLPARNAAADLPGWLQAAARVADRVIALDDGSTDATAELLEGSPLVELVLRNPVRPGYAGWDDAANRQRLLDAAIERGGGWVLYLDADERIDADDAGALREFVAGGADPERAYGFRVFRMVGDADHYDRAELWVYRLFRARSGASLPTETLHLVPVPTSIPRDRWRRTTIRIQHLAGLDPARRRARVRKYAEADPAQRWQRDYSALAEVGPVRRDWVPRPADLPVLADPLGRGPGAELDLVELDPGAPLLSAIVIARDDVGTIERSVRAVVEQRCSQAFEVIVAASGRDGTAALVRRTFPTVIVADVPEPGLPGAARNTGLALARGDFVSFPGSHVELPQGSLEARIAAHERGYAMVTGSILNGTLTRSGWASYFLDHSGSTPGRPSGELRGPPAHCSYSREALLEVGGFPEDMRAGEDTVVNRELWQRGHRAYRASEVTLTHRSPCTTPRRLVAHHFKRGQALGRLLVGDYRGGSGSRRLGVLRYLAGYPRWRLRHTDERVAEWGADLRERYRGVRPLVVTGTIAACVGAALEALRPRRRAPASAEQLRGGHGRDPLLVQDGDYPAERLDGGAALAGAVVQEHY